MVSYRFDIKVDFEQELSFIGTMYCVYGNFETMVETKAFASWNAVYEYFQHK